MEISTSETSHNRLRPRLRAGLPPVVRDHPPHPPEPVSTLSGMSNTTSPPRSRADARTSRTSRMIRVPDDIAAMLDQLAEMQPTRTKQSIANDVLSAGISVAVIAAHDKAEARRILADIEATTTRIAGGVVAEIQARVAARQPESAN